MGLSKHFFLIISVVLAMLGFAAHASAAAYVERASVDSAGVPGNSFSGAPTVSGDGGVIAFNSTASNLVDADTNGVTDVFAFNRATGQTERVSVSSLGVEGNAASGGPHNGGNYTSEPAISSDGNIVVFHSLANNLVPDDTNNLIDVFAHNLTTGVTTRVNVSSAGAQATVTNPGIYPGRGVSVEPAITADGSVVVFRSEAGNLVAGDTNGEMSGGEDIFAHNLATGVTTRVSPSASSTSEGYSSGSARNPEISGDGGVVVFTSSQIVAVEIVSGQVSRVSTNSAGTAGGNSASFFAAVSGSGRFVSFISIATDLVAGDTNGKRDVFVRDRLLGVTTRATVSSSGEQTDGDSFNPTGISADGSLVTFTNQGTNLVPGVSGENIYTHDNVTGVTTHVAQGSEPAISADGAFVAFGAFHVFFSGAIAPTAVNDPETLAQDSAAETFDVLANDTDSDGGPKAIETVTQPVNGAVVLADDGSDLTYRPVADYCNTQVGGSADTFTYKLNGGSEATVSVTVTCAGAAPVATDDSETMLEDADAATIDVLANDTGAANEIASVTQPVNGTVVKAADGSDVTYTPDPGYCNDPSAAPTDDFTYTITGGDTATVAVTVTCVDDDSVAVDDARTVGEGSGDTSLFVMDNDTASDDDPEQVASVTQPANGTVAIVGGAASLTYRPDAGYCNSQAGGTADSFTYTLDGGSQATVKVTVTCAAKAPVLAPKAPGRCAGLTATLEATGPGRLTGTSGRDVIIGSSGRDVIEGGGGDDVICAGDGADRVSGGNGHDRLFGGAGGDVLSGGTGRDRISGSTGDDRLLGRSGNDRLAGGSGNERAHGGSGDDRVSGDSGNDSVSGDSGDDTVTGGSGRDRLYGRQGKDRLLGADIARDQLNCGEGHDSSSTDRRDTRRRCETRRD